MFERLKKIAQEALDQNQQLSLQGPVMPAGGHQFKTLWTRDFCYSVPGLLIHQQHALVENQLELILKHKHAVSHLIPRGLDTIPPQLRVVVNTFSRWIPRHCHWFGYQRPLKAEYKGEHGTLAFDSNLLTLIASAHYGRQNPAWLQKHHSTFQKLLDFYRPFFQDGLLHQPAFSDWQDSSRRNGATLYSQILYIKCLVLFEDLGMPLAESTIWQNMVEKVHRTFYRADLGLYVNTPGSWQVPLESNLWIVEMGCFESCGSRTKLYENLKSHDLWRKAGLPGLPVAPRYTSHEVSWTCKAVGLKGYHDSFLWSWLIAESARVACLQNDLMTAKAILTWLESRAQQDGTIYEIYQASAPHKPFQTWLYKSESPFTWGAAKTLEALTQYPR